MSKKHPSQFSLAQFDLTASRYRRKIRCGVPVSLSHSASSVTL